MCSGQTLSSILQPGRLRSDGDEAGVLQHPGGRLQGRRRQRLQDGAKTGPNL